MAAPQNGGLIPALSLMACKLVPAKKVTPRVAKGFIVMMESAAARIFQRVNALPLFLRLPRLHQTVPLPLLVPLLHLPLHL
jgi:hypothetical protein